MPAIYKHSLRRCALALVSLSLFLSPTSLAEIRSYVVDIRKTEMNFTGNPVTAMTLDGGIPGPTLTAQVGNQFQVTFRNHMEVETSIHWHGVLLPNDQDGVPYLTTEPIAANSEFTYEFPITHHGTYWYHSHTGLQEQLGVYGALVFHPQQEQVPTDQDQVLVFSDWTDENPHQVLRNLKRDDDYYALKKDKVQSWDQILAHGTPAIKNRVNASWMRMGPMDLSDVGYDAFLVNGQEQIELNQFDPGETLRLRLINASASSYLNIRFAGGPLTIVAADGVDVQPLQVNELDMAVAETYDIVVKVPDQGQSELRATSLDGTGHSSTWIGNQQINTRQTDRQDIKRAVNDYLPPNPYLVDHSQHTDHDMSSMDHSGHDMNQGAQHEHHHHQHTNETQPSLGHYNNLRALSPMVADSDQPVREVLLRLTGDMRGYRWSFNDIPLSSADRILISKGERVRFVLKNETMMNHPIHLHGHFFRVLTDQGEYSPIKHTVNVPNRQTVVIEFDANEEKDWAFHCHNLYHMKAGMSRVIRYDDYQGEPSLPSTIGKVMSTDNQYWSFADIGVLSNKAELSAWSFNQRNQWSLDLEHDWHDLTEIEADYQFRINRFTNLYAGIDIEEEQNNSETLAVAGVRYLLPGMIDSELRIDEEGDVRLELESEIQLTKRTELSWFWNTDNEYGATWHYEFNKQVALMIDANSDFDSGIGLKFRF